MNDRNELHPAGVPRLLDQYKQRRQAWLAQADELVRLRDAARQAAEREALEIVTTARRDVRRIVVQARRELLVLTAQLHAAVDAVDPARLERNINAQGILQAGARDGLDGVDAFQPTREAVLDARRGVRTVLDEARTEIEALAADASGPLLPDGLTQTPDGDSEGPIPTLEVILGEVARFAAGEASPVRDDSVTGQWRIDESEHAVPLRHGAFTSDLPGHFSDFHPTELDVVESSENEASSAATVDDTREPDVSEPRVFLASDDSIRSGRGRIWIGVGAAAGALAVAGTLWFLSVRRGQTRANQAAAAAATSGNATLGNSLSSTKPQGGAGARDVAATAARPAAATAADVPVGLAVEVRRTAWIQTIVDGKSDSRVYKAGETRRILGARSVTIRAGDAGAVFVAVDGRAAEPLGPSGTANTRQYSLRPDAVVVPAVATPTIAPPTAAAVVEQTAAGRARATTSTPAVPAASNRADGGARAGAAGAGADPAPTTPSAPVVEAAGPAPVGADAPAPTGGNRADLVAAGQQWLDAYQRRDRDGMTTTGTDATSISDERSVTERFPAWQQGVRRELDQVELELTGDTALLTARMVERNADSPVSAQHVSRVSQIWVRRNGRWRLADVRIIGEGRLSQIVR